MASLRPMAEVAKIPHPYDMDQGWEGQFLQHWAKRHSIPGIFNETHTKFPDDSQPLWSAIRRLHERIHAGESEFDIPTDHIHLASVSKELEELL